jgi:uncharacterized alkaline shock family protein YloU
VQPEEFLVSSSELGDVSVSSAAVAEIVRYAATESYGVVGLAGHGRWSRFLPWGSRSAIAVVRREDGLEIRLRVVVEHGLRLAEVATAVRSRVRYEVERMVGLPVADLEVRIERVRSR